MARMTWQDTPAPPDRRFFDNRDTIELLNSMVVNIERRDRVRQICRTLFDPASTDADIRFGKILDLGDRALPNARFFGQLFPSVD